MRLDSIRAKLVLSIAATLAVSGLVSAVLIYRYYTRVEQAASEEALRAAASVYEEIERDDIQKISMTLLALASNPTLRDAFAAHDREQLQAAALPIHQVLKAEFGIGHWNFVDNNKQMFLRPHLPNKYGDVIERVALARAMARREVVAGKELGKSAFALRVARPFFGADGKVIGYIELGEEIDHFLDKMKAQTGNDFAMFIAKKNLDRSEWARTRGTARNGWDDWADVVVVKSTTSDQDSMVDADAVQGGGATLRVLSESRREGAAFARGVFPVRESSGAVVGGLVVRHDVSALKASMMSGLQQAFGYLIPLALLASAFVYFLVDRLIFRRLNQMKATMEDLSIRLAGGDFSVIAATRATKNDEIGAFEAFFGDFLVLVGNTMGDLAGRLKLQRQAGRPTVPPNP